jgi:hypothetical protein
MWYALVEQLGVKSDCLGQPVKARKQAGLHLPVAARKPEWPGALKVLADSQSLIVVTTSGVGGYGQPPFAHRKFSGFSRQLG